MNELEKAWLDFQQSSNPGVMYSPPRVFEEGWRRGLEQALRVMRKEQPTHDVVRKDETHGFMEADIIPGSHTKDCKDVICDGCVSLKDCGVCGRPEFEHGDGDE